MGNYRKLVLDSGGGAGIACTGPGVACVEFGRGMLHPYSEATECNSGAARGIGGAGAGVWTDGWMGDENWYWYLGQVGRNGARLFLQLAPLCGRIGISNRTVDRRFLA